MLRVLSCLLAAMLVPVAALAGPCVTAKPVCTAWLSLESGRSARSLVYRTHPLLVKNAAIVRALVIVHETGRDVAGAFEVALASAAAAGVQDETLIIAPRFSSNDGGLCRDALAAREVNWPCIGDSWRSGGLAVGGRLSSFDLVDEILLRCADKAVFPNLLAIVVAGHSAGAQFVSRYAMANRVHDRLGVPVSYVVANPSSYAYLDETRPLKLHGRLQFPPFAGAESCTAYDSWPYGLKDRNGYTRRMSSDTLRQQAADRSTTYLIGGRDVVADAFFDTSCAAAAQGATRLERGLAFGAYMNQKFGAHQTVLMIPSCAHDARCVMTATGSLSALFPGSRRSSGRAAN